MKQDVIIAVAKRWTDMSEWADVSVITPSGEIIEGKKIKDIDYIEYSFFDEENKGWDNIPSFEQRKEMLHHDSRSSVDELISRKNKLLCLIAGNHFQEKYNIIKVISV